MVALAAPEAQTVAVAPWAWGRPALACHRPDMGRHGMENAQNRLFLGNILETMILILFDEHLPHLQETHAKLQHKLRNFCRDDQWPSHFFNSFTAFPKHGA